MRNESSKKAVTRGAAVAVLAVGLALAGCGGGSTTVIKQVGSGSTTTTASVKGSTDLATNLEGLMKKSHRELENLQVKCPNVPTPPTQFPITCTMTAIDTSAKSGKDPLKPAGEHVPVSGTLKIDGVYAPTHSYFFEADFSPTKNQG